MHFTAVGKNSVRVVLKNSEDIGKSVEELDVAEKEKKEKLALIESEQKYQQAYDEGWKSAQQGMELEVDELQKKLKNISKTIPKNLNQYFIELEQQIKVEIAELSIKIADTILHLQLARKPLLKTAIAEALESLIRYDGVEVHFSNDDMDLLKDNNTEIIPPGIILRPDPALQSGDVVVYTQQGWLDGTIQRRLFTIKEQILKKLAEEKADHVQADTKD